MKYPSTISAMNLNTCAINSSDLESCQGRRLPDVWSGAGMSRGGGERLGLDADEGVRSRPCRPERVVPGLGQQRLDRPPIADRAQGSGGDCPNERDPFIQRRLELPRRSAGTDPTEGPGGLGPHLGRVVA